MQDELGHRTVISSDGLNVKYVRVSPGGERVFEVVGTVEVSEYGLNKSRERQDRMKTGAQKKQAGRESPVPKPKNF